jgi:hypothetical protein
LSQRLRLIASAVGFRGPLIAGEKSCDQQLLNRSVEAISQKQKWIPPLAESY